MSNFTLDDLEKVSNMPGYEMTRNDNDIFIRRTAENAIELLKERQPEIIYCADCPKEDREECEKQYGRTQNEWYCRFGRRYENNRGAENRMSETEREVTATGWLSPDGEFIPCPPYGHISAARDIVKKIGTTTKYEWRSWSLNNLPGDVPPDDVLYGNGWISIEIRSIGERGFDFCRNFHAPATDIQVKMLREFAEKHDFFMSEHGRRVLQEIDNNRKGDYLE